MKFMEAILKNSSTVTREHCVALFRCRFLQGPTGSALTSIKI